MSLRSSLWRYLGLLAVAALAVGVFAGPASAKKLSAKQRAAVRAQLRKQIKHNPKAIESKRWLRRAGLVDFKLPVTIQLRGDKTAANPNNATVDLGASLGQREVDLGGKLAAEVVFHDSYDGGALGNVDVNILPGPKSLTSTSIPLLWNTQVSQAGTSWDSNLIAPASPAYAAAFPAGCGNVHANDPSVNTSGNMQFGYGAGPQPGGPTNLGPIGAGGLPGVPIYASLAAYAANTPSAFAPAHVGTNPATSVGDINAVKASKITGNNDYVGGNPDPFPASPSFDPGADGTTAQPTPADTVLRTNALSLQVTPPGEKTGSSVSGGDNQTAGKSGGEANLFGNIPGKSVGIDVTVNLQTQISSIYRVVDQDAFEPLIAGGNWPAAVFSCGQIWSGYTQNYIPGVRLQGSLKIAPGITSDGHLRIAKATIGQHGTDVTHFQVAACLAPYAAYNAAQNSSDTVTPTVPSTPAAPDGTVSLGSLPVDENTERPAPNVPCNTAPTAFVASTALPPATVAALAPAVPANGYTTTASGATVSVSADLKVNLVSADILVGDV